MSGLLSNINYILKKNVRDFFLGFRNSILMIAYVIIVDILEI